MNKATALRLFSLLLCVLALLFLGACRPSDTAQATAAGSYVIPELKTAAYDPAQAQTFGPVSIDTSALSQGYVAVSATSARRLKFQVLCLEQTYTYDLAADAVPAVFPLNMGSGHYTFRVMENVSGDKYTQLWSGDYDVTLENEFAPFLRPSQMVPYTADSTCVALAAKLAQSCSDDAALSAAVYDYLVENVAYDYEKAASVQSGYLPDPDQTLATGTGICFDYAALAAAMLRSMGIPCKMITGYVDPDEIYHAWNVIYLAHQGWITVEIKASADTWKRVDITFAANGVDDAQLDDDSLYTTRYIY